MVQLLQKPRIRSAFLLVFGQLSAANNFMQLIQYYIGNIQVSGAHSRSP